MLVQNALEIRSSGAAVVSYRWDLSKTISALYLIIAYINLLQEPSSNVVSTEVY